MAYAVGDTISNSDYNGLLNNTASGTPNAGVAARGINYIAGTGAGEYGLGQTELNSVGAVDVIQAAQWNSLFTFMNNIANHSNDTLTSTTAVSAGDVIVGGDAEGLPQSIIEELSTIEDGDAPEQSRN